MLFIETFIALSDNILMDFDCRISPFNMLPSRAMRLLRRRCVARPVLYYTVIALLLCAGILYSFTAFDKGVWSQNRRETIINQT